MANREFSTALRARLDPADVVQDILLKAWRHFPDFRGENEIDLLAWLRQILLRNLANERRRHLRTGMRSVRREIARDTPNTKQLPDYIDCDTETPSTPMRKREQHEELQTALRQLPEHYRQVLLMHTQEGMTFAQIGERLDCSPEAARKLWVRAAEKLARLLSDTSKL